MFLYCPNYPTSNTYIRCLSGWKSLSRHEFGTGAVSGWVFECAKGTIRKRSGKDTFYCGGGLVKTNLSTIRYLGSDSMQLMSFNSIRSLSPYIGAKSFDLQSVSRERSLLLKNMNYQETTLLTVAFITILIVAYGLRQVVSQFFKR